MEEIKEVAAIAQNVHNQPAMGCKDHSKQSGNFAGIRDAMQTTLMIFIEQDLILKEDKGAYNHV
jgi:hypothetical protein